MFMQEAGLFQGIASHIINEIAGIATEEVLPDGYVIFNKDDVADYLYILEEGEIHIAFPGRKSATIRITKSGNMFGWSALVEPNKYTAKATCAKESKVLQIDGDRLMRVFENHPSAGLLVMKRLAGVISARLVEIDQEGLP
jgi:CRP-like cAMP-binding protein